MAYEIEYIGASWCTPCKTVKPQILERATKYALPVKTYDIDDDADEPAVESVKKLPTIRIKQGDQTVAELITNHIQQFDEFLTQNMKVSTTDTDF